MYIINILYILNLYSIALQIYLMKNNKTKIYTAPWNKSIWPHEKDIIRYSMSILIQIRNKTLYKKSKIQASKVRMKEHYSEPRKL